MNRSRSIAGPVPALPALLLVLAMAGCGDKPRSADATARETARGAAGDAAQGEASPPADPAAEAAALDQGPRAIETMTPSATLAATGQVLFDAKGCTGCHEFGSAENAPDLRGVASRRTEAWLLRQVVAPEWMAEHDPLTRAMVEQYGVPMADLGVTAEEAAAVLQFLLAENGDH